MKYFLITFFAVLLLASCDENQQVVKKLEGTWEVTEYNQEPVTDSTPFFFQTITFNDCKLSDNEYCDGSIIISDAFPISIPVQYNVQQEGKYIGFTIPLGQVDSTMGSSEVLLEIVSLEKDDLKLQVDGSVVDLKKID